VLAELCRRVDHEEVEHSAQHYEQLADQGGRHPLGIARRDRRQQHVQPGAVGRQQRGRACGVDMAGHGQRVAEGAHRVELNTDRQIAECEVEVDCAHPMDAVRGQRRGKVGREGGLAATALGGEHGDYLALMRRCRLVVGTHFDTHLSRQRTGALARGRQGRVVSGCDHFPHAGSQRLGEQRDIDLPAHKDDARGRSLQTQVRGEPERLAGFDIRADNDQVLGGVVEQGAARGAEVLDGAHRTDDARGHLVRPSGQLANDRHRDCPYFDGANWGTT
jgi:hypothetical protein